MRASAAATATSSAVTAARTEFLRTFCTCNPRVTRTGADCLHAAHESTSRAEKAFRTLLEESDLPPPDDVSFDDPASVLFLWHERKLAVVIDLAEPAPPPRAPLREQLSRVQRFTAMNVRWGVSAGCADAASSRSGALASSAGSCLALGPPSR